MFNNKKSQLLELFTPSWVINVVGISLGVLVTGAVIVLNQYQGSDIRQQIFTVQSGNQATSSTVSTISDNIANNNFLNSLPLLLVWAAVGLGVYYFAAAIIRGLGEAAELHEELEYVHASRQSLILDALASLGLRVLTVIGWFVFIKLTLSYFVPYALAAANAAASSWSLQNVGFALLSVAVIYALTYVHAVFLRLIAQKPRLFGG